MTTATATEKLRKLTLDLNKEYPRSPRETLGGYVIAARMLDKCRAFLNGTAGEYHFNCPLDGLFFDFTGLDADELLPLALRMRKLARGSSGAPSKKSGLQW